MANLKPESKKAFANLKRSELYKAFSSNKTITGFVTSIDQQNEVLNVHIGSYHMASLPFSEATIYDFTYNDRHDLPVEIYTLLNKPVQVKITKFEPENGIMFVSRKKNMLEVYEYVDSLPKYSSVQGTVTRVTNTMAFIDIGAGVTGTVYISEASVFRTSRISDILPVRTQSEFKVLGKCENKYFMLSNKELGREDLRKYVGQEFLATVDAPVRNNTTRGYFVHITPQLKGIMDVPKDIYLEQGAQVWVLVHNYSRRGLKLILKEIL